MFEKYFEWFCRSAKKYLGVFAVLAIGLFTILCFSQFNANTAFADETSDAALDCNKLDTVPLAATPINTVESEVGVKPLADTEDVAFAVYSADDHSLVFYADEAVPSKGDKYNGKTVTDVFTGFDSTRYSSASGQPWKSYRSDIYSVVADESFSVIQPIGMRYWFYGLENCSDFDLANIDTSQVNNMSYLFVSCGSIRSLDLSSWDTANVQTMYSMFHQCYNLNSVNLNGFDTSAVTTFGYMFYQCRSLISVDVSMFNTSKATYLSDMFYDCESLSTIDVSNFDTSAVTSMVSTFQKCTNLKHLDLSGWDTSCATSYSSFLKDDSKLLDITVGDNFTLFEKSTSALTDIQTWYDVVGNVVSDNYLIGKSLSAGTYYTSVPVQEITTDMFDVDINDKTYTGETITPDVSSDLVLGSDYIVEYDDNINVGFGTIIITGISRYEGTLNYEFEILPADVTITVDSSTKTYGENDPTFTGTVTGLIHSDDLGTITYVRDEGENVGEYTISAHYTDNSNYDVTVVEGTLTIVAADMNESGITVTVTDDGEGDFTYNGKPHTPHIVVADKDGNALEEGVDYTVDYSDNTDAGTGHIVIKGIGNYGGEISTEFDIAAADVTIECADVSKVYGTSDPTLTGTVDGLADGDDLNVVYSRDTGEDVGVYTISATYTDNPNYNVSVETAVFSIIAAEITLDDISGVDNSYIYTGSAIDPVPVVVVNGTTLIEGQDYTVTYGDNVRDEGSVTVEGCGNYTGTVEITFNIGHKDISEADVTIDDSNCVYNGQFQTPDVTVVIDGHELIRGTDFDVVYTDNIDAGDATATIYGMGDYTGTYVASFTIAVAPVTITVDSFTKTYGENDPIFTGTVSGLVHSDDLGTITYTRESGENVGEYTVSANYTENANYAVTTVDGTLTIVAADMSDSGITVTLPDGDTYEYTGNEIAPNIVVTDAKSNVLKEGIDYTVTYKDNVEIGTGHIVIKGIGNYDGEISTEFDIVQSEPVPIEITPEMFEVDTSYAIYDGSTPVTKTIKSDLIAGIDYTVEYVNNTSAGEATIIITGIGNYKGTLEYTFKIIHYFEDVGMYITESNNWYFNAVYDLVDQNVITGYNQTIFGVGDNLSRAQLVTIMWRYCEPTEYEHYNEGTAKNTTDLPDNPDGTYYTGAVNWAYEAGVVTGNLQPDGTYTFNPDDPITFEQMITIVARYCLGGTEAAASYPKTALNDGNFTDKDAVSEFACGAMSWAIKAGVVTGNQNSDGTYTIAPLENVARERGATVLARAIQAGLVMSSG